MPSASGAASAVIKPLGRRLEARVALVASLYPKRSVTWRRDCHDWRRVGDTARASGDSGNVLFESRTWETGLIAKGILEDNSVTAVVKLAHVTPETEALLFVVATPGLGCGRVPPGALFSSLVGVPASLSPLSCDRPRLG